MVVTKGCNTWGRLSPRFYISFYPFLISIQIHGPDHHVEFLSLSDICQTRPSGCKDCISLRIECKRVNMFVMPVVLFLSCRSGPWRWPNQIPILTDPPNSRIDWCFFRDFYSSADDKTSIVEFKKAVATCRSFVSMSLFEYFWSKFGFLDPNLDLLDPSSIWM